MALAVFALAFACFLPALGAGFVDMDDGPNFVANTNYRGLAWTNLHWMFTTFHMGHYQPLSWLTLALDYLVWGMDARGYHLTSVVLHSATAVGFFFLSRRLLRAGGAGDEAEVAGGALFAALVFAMHPLRVESVAWITERRDVLAGLFYVASLAAYVKMQDDLEKPGYAKVLVLFACSLLAKAWAVTMPVVLLVLDRYPLRRREGLGSLVAEKVPFFVLSGLFAVSAGMAQSEIGATRTLAQYGVAERLAQACYGLAFYVAKTLVPLGLYPLHKLEDPVVATSPAYLACGAAVVVVAGTAFALRRRAPAVPAALLAYAITVLPVLGLVQSGSQKVADRYSYLACLPLALLGGVAAIRLARRVGRGPVLATGAALLLALGALTWRQAGTWKDAVTLWSHAVEVEPSSAILWSNRATALEQAGRMDDALADYRHSLELDPADPRTRLNLGLAYTKVGRIPDAMAEWTTLLQRTPGYCEAHFCLGVGNMKTGQVAQAESEFRAATECEPNYVEAWSGLAQVLKAQGRTQEAAEALQRRSLITTPWHRPYS